MGVRGDQPQELGAFLHDVLIEARALKHPEFLPKARGLRAWWHRRAVRPDDVECPSCGRPMRVIDAPTPTVREWACPGPCIERIRISRPDLR